MVKNYNTLKFSEFYEDNKLIKWVFNPNFNIKI